MIQRDVLMWSDSGYFALNDSLLRTFLDGSYRMIVEENGPVTLEDPQWE